MDIVFILPCYKKDAPGGFKVVYDYANRLSDLGHKVSVVIPQKPSIFFSKKDLPKERMRQLKLIFLKGLKEIYHSFKACIRSPKRMKNSVEPWLNSTVTFYNPFSLNHFDFSKTQVVIASWWENALWIAESKVQSKVYLCQHYEDWGGELRFVQKSYEAKDLHLISISKWVQGRIFENHKRSSFLLSNGLDSTLFHIERNYLERKYDLGLILRFDESWKGSDIALDFIRNLPKDTKVLVASYGQLPDHASDPRIELRICRNNEEMRDFYNECKAFIFTSHFEGFGLPILEAMLCGNVVISTKVGCAEDLIINGENGFLSPEISSLDLLKTYHHFQSIDLATQFTISQAAHQKGLSLNPKLQALKLENYLFELCYKPVNPPVGCS